MPTFSTEPASGKKPDAMPYVWHAVARLRMFVRHLTARADSVPPANEPMSTAERMPRMPMTTSSSTRVKPFFMCVYSSCL